MSFVHRLLAHFQAWLIHRSHGSVLKMGSILGFVWSRILPFRRGLVMRNLVLAFPDRPVSWHRQVMRNCFKHYSTLGLELLWQPAIDMEWVEKNVHFKNIDGARRLLAEGRGLIAVGGHFGNWEIMGMACALVGLPLSYIVKRMHDPAMDALINNSRRRHGNEILYSRTVGRKLADHFKRGRVVSFLNDQDAGKKGVFVPLLGTLASTPKGAAAYALKYKVPMMFVSGTRLAGGRFEVEFSEIQVEDHLEACEESIKLITERTVKHLEARILAAPEQWFWMHRRWKTRPKPKPAEA
jgi:Kdo2-lipid IVA lauroyltransferase/acyltransferase